MLKLDDKLRKFRWIQQYETKTRTVCLAFHTIFGIGDFEIRIEESYHPLSCHDT